MNAMARTEEEARLEFFVGDWTNAGHVASGAFGGMWVVSGCYTRAIWSFRAWEGTRFTEVSPTMPGLVSTMPMQ